MPQLKSLCLIIVKLRDTAHLFIANDIKFLHFAF